MSCRRLHRSHNYLTVMDGLLAVSCNTVIQELLTIKVKSRYVTSRNAIHCNTVVQSKLIRKRAGKLGREKAITRVLFSDIPTI